MEEGRPAWRGLLEWVAVFAVAIAVTLGVRAFVVEPYVVPSGSMEDTILIGDQLFAQKVTFETGGSPERGQIVVFRNPDASAGHDVLIKRVIALGGQTVDLRDGAVYVDGRRLDEPYAKGVSEPLPATAPGASVSFPYKVPEGSVWVMGDNRENSADSRYFGAVPRQNLVGIAVLRYWPLDRLGALE